MISNNNFKKVLFFLSHSYIYNFAAQIFFNFSKCTVNSRKSFLVMYGGPNEKTIILAVEKPK